jgi:glycosyltransferase involved in cell wall biosynthesis
MLKHFRDWWKIYFDWKKNYVIGIDSLEGLEKDQVIYLRYFRLPRGIFHHLEGYFAYYQAKRKLSRIITKDSIIHANWIFPAGTMAKIISAEYKVPFIISLLGSDVNRLTYGTRFWKAAKKLLQDAQKVTSVTDDLINTCAEKRIDIEKSKAEIISNIYETDKFIIKNRNQVRDALGIDHDIKLILFAGGLIQLKNVDVLINAVSNILLKHSDILLYIEGSGAKMG